MNKSTIFLNLFLVGSFLSVSVSGQETQEQTDNSRRAAVKVYLDCRNCDMNYTRQEIPYINYVRDVKEAQVFILVTDQNAGNGGRQYTYTFQGQGDFEGMDDTLTYSTSPDQSTTLIREKRTNMLKMGLMRYVARTPLVNEIEITHNRELESEEVIDNWNYWVFQLSTEPRFDSEEANKQLNFRNSVNISRVTPVMKLEIGMDQSYNRRKVIENAGTDSEETSIYITNRNSMDNLIVRSLGEHWSTGMFWRLGSSTRENYTFQTEIMPSVEFDIYPYSESTHRQLRILYSAGYQYNNYIDSTIFNKTSESLYLQTLRAAYQVQKKWGSINISLTGSNYFNDLSKNRLQLSSFVNIRLFKGLSLRLSGGVAHINDQYNLKKGDISEAERLLRLTELATKYRIDGGVEITYTFGSIYNNVVNPRFGNGGNVGGGGGRGYY